MIVRSVLIIFGDEENVKVFFCHCLLFWKKVLTLRHQ